MEKSIPELILTKKDSYEILGLKEGADEEMIKRAHRQLMLQYHPDKQHGDEKDKDLMLKLSQHVNGAKDYLLDLLNDGTKEQNKKKGSDIRDILNFQTFGQYYETHFSKVDDVLLKPKTTYMQKDYSNKDITGSSQQDIKRDSLDFRVRKY